MVKFPQTLEDMESLVLAPPPLEERTLVFDASFARTGAEKLLAEASIVQWLATWTQDLHGRVLIEPSTPDSASDTLKRISMTLPGALLGMLDDQALIPTRLSPSC